MSSNVYVISDGAGHVKIGKANCIKSRMKQLQIGNANLLKLSLLIICGSEGEANDVERIIHKVLSYCHVRGEWYDEKCAMALLDAADGKLVCNRKQYRVKKRGE